MTLSFFSPHLDMLLSPLYMLSMMPHGIKKSPNFSWACQSSMMPSTGNRKGSRQTCLNWCSKKIQTKNPNTSESVANGNQESDEAATFIYENHRNFWVLLLFLLQGCTSWAVEFFSWLHEDCMISDTDLCTKFMPFLCLMLSACSSV